MGITRIASASQKSWVEITCDQCNTRYSCLVEGHGRATDTFVPVSDDTLRDAACYDLRASMNRMASRVPCPTCGAYGNSYVEDRQRMVGRLVFWPAFFLLGLLLLVLIAVLAPKTEDWVLLVIPVVAWLAARVLAAVAVGRVDPNRDLEANRKLTQQKIAGKIVRVEPAGGLAQPRDTGK